MPVLASHRIGPALNRLILPVLVLSLSGCAPAMIIYTGSKTESTRLVARIMAEKQPTKDPEAAAACVMAAMTRTEIIGLGTSDISSTTLQHRAKVDEVLARPGVAQCLAALPQKAT